jgi:hypothetical protein
MEALYPVIAIGCVVLFFVSIWLFKVRLSEERDRHDPIAPGVEDESGGSVGDLALEVGLWWLFG